jgi:hypothetical protein
LNLTWGQGRWCHRRTHVLAEEMRLLLPPTDVLVVSKTNKTKMKVTTRCETKTTRTEVTLLDTTDMVTTTIHEWVTCKTMFQIQYFNVVWLHSVWPLLLLSHHLHDGLHAFGAGYFVWRIRCLEMNSLKHY